MSLSFENRSPAPLAGARRRGEGRGGGALGACSPRVARLIYPARGDRRSPLRAAPGPDSPCGGGGRNSVWGSALRLRARRGRGR